MPKPKPAPKAKKAPRPKEKQPARHGAEEPAEPRSRAPPEETESAPEDGLARQVAASAEVAGRLWPTSLAAVYHLTAQVDATVPKKSVGKYIHPFKRMQGDVAESDGASSSGSPGGDAPTSEQGPSASRGGPEPREEKI